MRSIFDWKINVSRSSHKLVFNLKSGKDHKCLLLIWLFFCSMTFFYSYFFPMMIHATIFLSSSLSVSVSQWHYFAILNQVAKSRMRFRFATLFLHLSLSHHHIWTHNPKQVFTYKSLFNVSNERIKRHSRMRCKKNWQRAYRILFIFFTQIVSSLHVFFCSPEQILKLCTHIDVLSSVHRFLWKLRLRMNFFFRRSVLPKTLILQFYHQICMALSTPFKGYQISFLFCQQHKKCWFTRKTRWHTDRATLFNFGGPVTLYSCFISITFYTRNWFTAWITTQKNHIQFLLLLTSAIFMHFLPCLL